jgi:hypothetical protein
MTAKIRKDGGSATAPILCDWRAFSKNIWTVSGGG